MNTVNMPTNTNMPAISEKEIIAGHQKRLKEIEESKAVYLNDTINPCPTNTATFEVSIKL